jgi:hypothetical protein
MKRIVRLTESDLTRIVRRVLSEQETNDPKLVGTAKKIVGDLLTAMGGAGTDDALARKSIYAINSKPLYNAVIKVLQTSPTVKSQLGYNFNTVCAFIGTDMSYAAGSTTTKFGDPGNPSSPGALYQQLTGSAKQYADYERHLQQFNSNERLPREKNNAD